MFRLPTTLSRAVVFAVATGWLACTAAAASTEALEQLPEGAQVLRLDVYPASIALQHRFDDAQLLVFAELTTGERIDVTRIVAFQQTPKLVDISPHGHVRATTSGSGQISLSLSGLTVSVPLEVSGVEAPYEVDFVRDVMPLLSKLGCNAGTCHGAKQGKNGFKLSLRGYDPAHDHRALTDDLAGRRFNRAAPDQSLMLLKTAGNVPHVGGVRAREGEPYYEILRQWIADGVQIKLDGPRVTGIELQPKNPLIAMPGMAQQMIVFATYSDGTRRDVTAETFIESGQIDILEANSAGVVRALRRGESPVLARYEGAYASTTVTVMGDRGGFVWEAVPEYNFIDTLVHNKLKQVKVRPSPTCTDATFIRRLYLDLTGLPPRPEDVRAFLADEQNSREKRDALVDRLIGSPDYVELWTNKWADLLMVNRKFLGEKGAWSLRRWIHDAVSNNMPYDEFAHEFLTASGSTYINPPASYYRSLRDPTLVMENSTQLFLGVRFNCNKCHDHPFERWTQKQYYDLSAFFAQVGRKKGVNPGEEIVFDTVGRGEVLSPVTGTNVAPAFPFAHADVAPEGANRREQFARWATSSQNQYFATSFVNRIWSYLLGAGIIEPVDDIRAGNPPTNPELLAELSRQFVASGFNVREVVRSICKSHTYQHAVATNSWNKDDAINYSHAIVRRLPAETLYDAIQQATGANGKLPGVPSGYRAVQLADSSTKLPGGFLDLFGRPPRESACECERNGGMMLSQALTLINGPVISDALVAPENRIARVVAEHEDNARVVEELFLSILCRFPTDKEIETGKAAIQENENRLEGTQDLAWALLNSPAFLFNH